MLAAFGFVGLGLLALAIGAILAMLLSLGRNSLFSALGVFYAGLPAVALIWLRSDAQLGLLAVAFLIVAVVISDTAGFLAGRLLGGPKLWPRVSPNKTWSGFVGALVASSIAAALFWIAVPQASAVRLAGDRRRAVIGGAGRRSRRIRHQASFRRQGHERSHPRPWRRHGSRRRTCGRGDGGRLGCLRHQRAFARARTFARVLRVRRPACRQCVQNGWRLFLRRRLRPGASPATKRISVLGATGSVGTSTLDLIGRTPHLFEVVALTAQSNVEALADCARAPSRRTRRRRRS